MSGDRVSYGWMQAAVHRVGLPRVTKIVDRRRWIEATGFPTVGVRSRSVVPPGLALGLGALVPGIEIPGYCLAPLTGLNTELV